MGAADSSKKRDPSARPTAPLTLLALLLWCQQVSGFHLSFGQRVLRSASSLVANNVNPSPQLNPASSLIRPIECRNVHNQSEAGICMFSIDCMHNKGVPLSICKHNYFVGTCCKLPDYNDFVGIVYDLRDTETNQILEARKVSAQSQTISYDVPKTNASEPPTIPAAARPEDKYIISATSLFPPTSPAATPSPQQVGVSESPPMSRSTPAKESARNSDGQVPPDPKQSALVANELDSFQIQSSQPTAVRGEAPKSHAYEIIKDDNSEVLSTLNSAHSPAAAATKHSEEPNAATSAGQLGTPIILSNNHQHQQPEVRNGSSRPLTSSTPPQTTSDQEFTLNSVPATDSSQASVATASTQEISSTVAATTTTTTTTTPTPSSSPSLSSVPGETRSATQSPAPTSEFVDLVSEHSSASTASASSLAPSTTVQTTTPFTTSLSTAMLPNVSSHPWNPTQAPPSALQPPVLVSSPSPSAPQLYSSTSYRFSATSASTSHPSTQQPPTSEQPAAVGFSQLYSNQHSSAPTPGHASASTSDTDAHFSGSHLLGQSLRPNLILSSPTMQATSKIVSGSSSTNNLIPGLSGLHSALLSHIPFKLASGLSTGLSSYLQAAMKPTGGKPLISSNTAPSLQYQQQALHNSSTTSGTRQSTVAPTTVAASSVKFPSSLADSPTSAKTPATGGVESPLNSRDAMREAQLICGRPQVAQATSGDISKRRVARIVGGNQSLFGQWPWMVSLRQWRKGAFLHKCGAALLNENWAITAAHCVENVKASDLLLRLGEFDVSNQEEPYPYVERRVKTVVSHPSFDPKTFEYDLALLRFAEPIRFERNIVPVCVPSGNDSYVDRMATVIGWGRLYEDGPLPDIIQHVDVPIITNNECERMYKSAGYIEEIPDMFICAGINKGGRDSCEGDSGGPLTMVDNDGRSYLVGIISWGIGCALPSQPGVYTRITAFSGWINQMIDY